MPSAQLQIGLPERYRVQRHVATGGMAAVYAATDEILAREVAVKVLSPALGADESARERFTREARAAARVSDHPHVVTIYDIGETEGEPPVAFIVMELLTGGTVHDRLRAGQPIPHATALRWLEQTAAALDAAHAAGIVHRDVKPANLLLDAKGVLKVGDFGIATLATDAPLTLTGHVVGTAAYFAPEQAAGRPATAASDRYALAVVAFELLTGQRPFPPGPPAAQALAHVQSEPRPATRVAPGLPPAVDAVLARGLAKAPEARPASAAGFVAALHDALGPTATTGAALPAPLPETEVAPRRTPRPRRPVAAAASRADVPRPRHPGAATAGPTNRTGVLAALAAMLLLAGAAVAAITAGGGAGGEPAAGRSTAGTAPRTRRPSTATAAPSAPAGPTTAPRDAAAPPRPPADAAAVQASAHRAIVAGDYAGAAGQLRGLVERCPVQITDPCAYAWYDLGYALRRAGDPAGAIPVLEHRLQNPNQAGTVQAELDAARAQVAGGEAAGAGKGPPGLAKKDGKGKPDD